MADKKLTPISIEQNPYPVQEKGQQYLDATQKQVENILAEFLDILPSNYVSEVTGPHYTLRFQAAAEQLARFQITAQEVFEDYDYDFTRPEFLWQTVISLVFPEGQTRGIPTIEGDISYRSFIKAMVLLLLRGATPDVIKEGIELLTDAEVIVIEKFLTAGQPGSAWTLDDQFGFEVFIEQDGGTAFPNLAFILQNNVRLVLDALKPAHTLYDYSHLFRELFEGLLSDAFSGQITDYHYSDFRKYCQGLKRLTGTEGETLSDKFKLRDVTRDFSHVCEDVDLEITDGVNEGLYCVTKILTFLVDGEDTTPRAYTTSPTGLTGTLTVDADGHVEDTSQNWGLAVEGEVLTILEGPKAGQYRLACLLGNDGGLVGLSSGPATRVSLSPSILCLDRRMNSVATGQSYEIELDHLGVKTPKPVTMEDISHLFYI